MRLATQRIRHLRHATSRVIFVLCSASQGVCKLAKIAAGIVRVEPDTSRGIGATGTSRIDFLFQPHTEQLYLNEINAIPGSLAYYLWEASGIPFDALVEKLVTIALRRREERARTQFSFEVNLLRKKDETVSETVRTAP